MSASNPSAERYVAQYFVDRMNAAGYDARLGYDVPDFGRKVGTDNKVQCEIWLSTGIYKEWENNEYPVEVEDTIECYIYLFKGSSHVAGDWYDACSTAIRALTRNTENRTKKDKLWWDNKEVKIDRTSPLKRWDGMTETSSGFLVALIELPIEFLTTIVP
jgi:hypothetical protein